MMLLHLHVKLLDDDDDDDDDTLLSQNLPIKLVITLKVLFQKYKLNYIHMCVLSAHGMLICVCISVDVALCSLPFGVTNSL